MSDHDNEATTPLKQDKGQKIEGKLEKFFISHKRTLLLVAFVLIVSILSAILALLLVIILSTCTSHGIVMAHYEIDRNSRLHDGSGINGIKGPIISGYTKTRSEGNLPIELENEMDFVVEQDGLFSIRVKQAFVGNEPNAVIGIYIDDILVSKGPASNSEATSSKHKRVLMCEAEHLHVKLCQGQVINIRSFHDRELYKAEKTSWVHVEMHL